MRPSDSAETRPRGGAKSRLPRSARARRESARKLQRKCAADGIDPDGTANQFQRFVTAALLMRRHTGQMQRVGMVRINAENSPVDRFGLSDLPGLMLLHRQLQGLLDGHLRLRHRAFILRSDRCATKRSAVKDRSAGPISRRDRDGIHWVDLNQPRERRFLLRVKPDALAALHV